MPQITETPPQTEEIEKGISNIEKPITAHINDKICLFFSKVIKAA